MESVEALRIESRTEQGRIVVRLGGELDMASAPLLQSALEEAEKEASATLVLDLNELRFMDSTGLRIILWAAERCRNVGQQFALTPGASQVQRLLAVSGVGERVRIIATPDEMLV